MYIKIYKVYDWVINKNWKVKQIDVATLFVYHETKIGEIEICLN